MKNSHYPVRTALAWLRHSSGAARKGPLFLPGNPSEMRPQPPETEEPRDDDEDEDDEENPRRPDTYRSARCAYFLYLKTKQ